MVATARRALLERHKPTTSHEPVKGTKMQINVVNGNGTPAMCYRCGNPAVTFVNTTANAAGFTPSNMQPVCAEHDHYKLQGFALVERGEIEHLRVLLDGLLRVIERTNPRMKPEDVAAYTAAAAVALGSDERVKIDNGGLEDDIAPHDPL
jgi:hypothetical protein